MTPLITLNGRDEQLEEVGEVEDIVGSTVIVK
jgi:hypothetical protein